MISLSMIRRVLVISLIAFSLVDQLHAEEFRLSTFSADVTVPLGHGMMGGSWLSKSISDPLEAHGIVLIGEKTPAIVIVSVDWCEIRNEAFDRWKEVLAESAATTPDRVLVTAIHQHDAPVADLEAERILRERKLQGTVCDIEFHEKAVLRVATALKQSLSKTRPVNEIGIGKAKVEKVASNRRYTTPDGAVKFDRMSRTVDPVAVAAEEGTIDPWLRSISFWDGDREIAVISAYAVHPMSYYGQGEVSADFPGLARRRRQKETPGTEQIYVNGCAGNVVAGKYNDGTPRSRLELADRIYRAMTEASQKLVRYPLEKIVFRTAAVRLEPRNDAGYSVQDLERKLVETTPRFGQCLAAMGLSWRRRLDAGHKIEIPAIDFGPAVFMLLPGESYVEYQLAAQAMCPDKFVVVAGYGEGGTGYVPTEKHIADRDPNLGDWWWVAPGSEPRMLNAIRTVLSQN
jgi:hypothetical protein